MSFRWRIIFLIWESEGATHSRAGGKEIWEQCERIIVYKARIYYVNELNLWKNAIKDVLMTGESRYVYDSSLGIENGER